MLRTYRISLQTLILVFLFEFVISLVASAAAYSVASPDRSLELEFEVLEGVPTYSLKRLGTVLIETSKLGFELRDMPDLGSRFSIASAKHRRVDESWVQPWGEKREINCAYNELRLLLQQQDSLARQLVVVFRVFDDGVGFRYEWPHQPNLSELLIDDELTEFNLTEDSTAWWIPAYQDNRYEYLYQRSKVSELPTVHTPVTFQRKGGICLSIHEAALTDFASMTLARSEGHSLKADLVPWSDGIRVRARTPHQSPWRTIQVGENPGELITSYLILNLNEPCKLADTSWIEPGKYGGIWWELHLAKSTWGAGNLHGATTHNAMRHIDFAAENGLKGVLVEGWNLGWDGDWVANGDKFSFTQPYGDFDIKKVTDYAKSKGVFLIGHHETAGAVMNYESQLESAFSLYRKLGVRAVKTGYVNYGQNIRRIDNQGENQVEWHHGQHMVRHYRKVVEEAAKNYIMLDVHEPIKATGIRRTYPNMMTREGARGQEFNAWSEDGGNPPDHTTILPFTRMLAGPMDFTPGIFDVLFEQARPRNRVNTTLAKQLALYVVSYSPLQMVPDLPENYEAYTDAFEFICDVPTDWEDTVVLNGSIGDFVTIARKQRNGDEWFLGSITDECNRELEISLGFLDPNRQYVAEIYRDAEDAHWQNKPLAYKLEERNVDASTMLHLRLAPGGGQAIRFRPKEP